MRANDRYGDRMLKRRSQAKSVLVNLDALYPPPERPTATEGLELRGLAPGALHEWSEPTMARGWVW